MAHDLEIVNGEAQMFSVGAVPWHQLGKIVAVAPTAAEAIKLAGLDWKVEKRKTFFVNNQTEEITEAKGAFAVVRDRDEKYFGQAGATWQPLQNEQAFSFFDPYIQAGEAAYETAGALDGGRRIWILAKLKKDPIEVVKGDLVEKYILLSNRHYAGAAVIALLTPIRVVCANTEAMAFRSAKQMFRASHSNRLVKSMDQLQADIAAADEAFQQTAEFYKMFSKRNIKQEDFARYVDAVFGFQAISEETRESAFRKAQREAIQKLFEEGRGTDIKGVRGTMWGAYNAITEYIQHFQGVKRTDDKRLQAAWFGNGMELNVRAFELAKEMVAA